MPLTITLSNCSHINIARGNGTPLIVTTVGELQDEIRDGESSLLQRLKWLVREYQATQGPMTKAAIRTYLLDKEIE